MVDGFLKKKVLPSNPGSDFIHALLVGGYRKALQWIHGQGKSLTVDEATILGLKWADTSTWTAIPGIPVL